MRTAANIRWVPAVLAALILIPALVLILRLPKREKEPEQTPDPHEGQVYLYDGFDWVWMTPLEGVESNSLTAEDFSLRGTTPVYLGNAYTVRKGLDVSEHQKTIDWSQVANADIDYVFIRLGRRGYSEGGLFEDQYFRANMEGALRNGIPVGVYFFSQAINVGEALEEARYVIDHLRGYQVDLPVVYDWEHIEGVEDARTNGLPPEVVTDCAVAFCETVKNAGYESAVYFNRKVGYYGLDLRRLTDYQFWFALPESAFPNFYYAVDIWQYSFTETVPGVPGVNDMNLMFIPKE